MYSFTTMAKAICFRMLVNVPLRSDIMQKWLFNFTPSLVLSRYEFRVIVCLNVCVRIKRNGNVSVSELTEKLLLTIITSSSSVYHYYSWTNSKHMAVVAPVTITVSRSSSCPQ